MKKALMNTIKSIVNSELSLIPSEVSKMSLPELRTYIEHKNGKKMKIKSFFPLIGRGNVLGDKILSHEKVEELLSEALR
jgi:hypothetical protein